MKHYTGTNYSQVVNILLALSGKRKLVATSIDGKADERTDAAIHKDDSEDPGGGRQTYYGRSDFIVENQG